MKCAYCGKEMQAGVIQCRDGIYWSEKRRPIAAIPLGGGEKIRLNVTESNEILDELVKDYAKAWRCDKCRKIVIEY